MVMSLLEIFPHPHTHTFPSCPRQEKLKSAHLAVVTHTREGGKEEGQGPTPDPPGCHGDRCHGNLREERGVEDSPVQRETSLPLLQGLPWVPERTKGPGSCKEAEEGRC